MKPSAANLLAGFVVACVLAYMTDRFDVSFVDGTPDHVASQLRGVAATESDVSTISDFLRDADIARFSPPPHLDLGTLIARAEELIRSLENAK